MREIKRLVTAVLHSPSMGGGRGEAVKKGGK
jgi:hypothetical protein